MFQNIIILKEMETPTSNIFFKEKKYMCMLKSKLKVCVNLPVDLVEKFGTINGDYIQSALINAVVVTLGTRNQEWTSLLLRLMQLIIHWARCPVAGMMKTLISKGL